MYHTHTRSNLLPKPYSGISPTNGPQDNPFCECKGFAGRLSDPIGEGMRCSRGLPSSTLSGASQNVGFLAQAILSTWADPGNLGHFRNLEDFKGGVPEHRSPLKPQAWNRHTAYYVKEWYTYWRPPPLFHPDALTASLRSRCSKVTKSQEHSALTYLFFNYFN